jgi:sensor c-di-GMP phosphodiesterase-like protein
MLACGLLAGYLLGRALVLQQATNSLDQYLKLTAALDDASFTEARSVLNVLKNSPYPYCSDAEIAYFRAAVFRSEYLKDAGRIHGGKIDCSATADRLTQAIGPFIPDSRQDDGIIAYGNLVPIRDTRLKRAGLQLGSTYVVLDSNLPPSPGPVTLQLSPTMQDAALKQSSLPASEAPDGNELNPTTDGSGRVGNTLYATRCSTLHFNCVTASITVSEALHGGIVTLAASTFAGGLLGILFGMAFSFAYNRNRDLPQQLRRAVERSQMQVLYQPIVDLSTRRIVGAEALARWTDEEGNVVEPDVFVSIAENLGFVGGITKLVLRRALQDFAKTFQKHPKFRLSVNVAGADLVDPMFLPMLDESLKRANVKPENLVIEITERSAANGEVAMETIRILRRMGHSIHIDDFGTGNSNLDKLLYLFADTIKIDKAFTKVIGTESVAVGILPQILAMAKSLHLEVVVEGVETDYQADYFSPATQKMYGQGWLYGHPVTAEQFLAILGDDLSLALVTPDTVAAFNAKPGALYLVGSRVA